MPPPSILHVADGLESRTLLDRALDHLAQLENAAAPSTHIMTSWRRDALILTLLAAGCCGSPTLPACGSAGT
ncbi:MAG: hypothetical protein ACJ8H8_19930 [Geminicoccaceae bacterium]